MKQGTTVYLYELAWILPSIAIPVGMLVALAVTAFGVGIHLPSDAGRIDATKVAETPPFDQPGMVQIGPDRYEVRMIAGHLELHAERDPRAGGLDRHVRRDQPRRRPRAARDRHNVNVMLLPGQVARVTARFDRPGEYPFVCHEYCGIAHHTMWGKVIVEPRP